IDIRQIGRELGVRYVLEGSVRKAGQRLRITGQLVEVETGSHLWADRFDSVLEDVFDLQDRLAMAVAGAIEPSVTQAEIRRANRTPTENLPPPTGCCAGSARNSCIRVRASSAPFRWRAAPLTWTRTTPRPTPALWTGSRSGGLMAGWRMKPRRQLRPCASPI